VLQRFVPACMQGSCVALHAGLKCVANAIGHLLIPGAMWDGCGGSYMLVSKCSHVLPDKPSAMCCPNMCLSCVVQRVVPKPGMCCPTPQIAIWAATLSLV
jgi:hypothetical protein